MNKSRMPIEYLIFNVGAFLFLFYFILNADSLKSREPLLYYFLLFMFSSAFIIVVTASIFKIIRELIKYGIINKEKPDENNYEEKGGYIRCPNCYNKTTSNHKLCPKCGYKLNEDFRVIKCPNCFKKIRPNQKYCSCGYINEKTGGLIVMCPKCYNVTMPNKRFAQIADID